MSLSIFNNNSTSHIGDNWLESIQNAKMEYTFFGGRKFIIDYQGKVSKLTFKALMDASFDRANEECNNILSLMDGTIPNYLLAKRKIEILTLLPSLIRSKDETEKKNRQAYLYSPQRTFWEKLIHSILQVIKYFKFKKWRFFVNQSRFELLEMFINALPLNWHSSVERKIHHYNILILELKIKKEELLYKNYKFQREFLKDQKSYNDFRKELSRSHPQGLVDISNEHFKLFVENECEKLGFNEHPWVKECNEKIRTIEKEISNLENEQAQYKTLFDTVEEKTFFCYNPDELRALPANATLSAILNRLNLAKEHNSPEELFRLRANFTKDEVKNARKAMLLAIAPDKNPGYEKLATFLFQIINLIGTWLDKRAT